MRNNLIQTRKEAGYTQAQTAKALNVSTRHYNSLEAGTSNGSVEIWYKLKTLLESETIDFLLEQEDDKKPKATESHIKGGCKNARN